MSETGAGSNVSRMEVTTPTAGATSPVVLIRPQGPGSTPTTGVAQQIRTTTIGGRLINVAAPSPLPVARLGSPTQSPGIGGNVGGGFVLRGNQLVRVPVRGESPLAAGAKSPLKVHLVSATGLVKQQQLGPTAAGGGVRMQGIAGKAVGGGGQEQAGDVKPKYQVLLPSSQNSQQVVVVNSSGVTTKQSRDVAGKSAITGARAGESPVVYLGGGSVGASATVGEGALQSLSAAAVPPFKKSRSIGIPGARKPCNCTKSQCLKLYCECFANGEFCRNCNCTNCHNNLAYENERSKSIKMCLERNPYAFQPKIGKGRADTERLHNKGCNCKKSSCLKNYCECYEAKVPCTHRCKCVGCRNTEVDRIHKYRGAGGLQSLANAASILSASQPDYPARTDSPATEASYEKPDPKRMPWFYMTDDVVEATAVCLLAKAEKMESQGVFDDVECQREILKEFGRCLQQIINSAAD